MIVNFDEIYPQSNNKLARELYSVKKYLDNPNEWNSNLPDIQTLINHSLSDPALAGGNFSTFRNEVLNAGSTLDPLMQAVGRIAMGDFVKGMRVSLGTVATSTGMLMSDVMAVSTIMQSSQSDVMKGFDVVGTALDSPMFTTALDAIGAVPFVGWVIKAIYNISRTVAEILEQSNDLSDKVAKRSVAERLTIPIKATEFSNDANEFLTRDFFRTLSSDPQKLILPAYNPNPQSSSCPDGYTAGPWKMFCAAGVTDSDSWDAMAEGWMVAGTDFDYGFGYVPGTSAITRSLFFRSGVKSAPNSNRLGCEAYGIRDMGSLYPTPTNLCSALWSQVAKPGPAMFMFDPLAAKTPWESYMENMFALSKNLLKGWSCAPTGYPFTDKFECTSNLDGARNPREEGMGGCRGGTGKKHNRWGDKLTIPSDFGYEANTVLYAYLAELYFGIRELYNSDRGGIHRLPHLSGKELDKPGSYYENIRGSKFFRPDAIDYGMSTPVKALEALYNSQKATLDSRMCMYVNGEDPVRFPAFRDSNLKSLWQQSVTTVLNTNDWRTINYKDIPEGSAKQAFYQRAKAAGIDDVENFTGIKKHHQLQMQTVLGDPEPPEMPPMTGTDIDISEFGVTASNLPKRRSKKKSSNLPLILAAGAIGFLFLNNKK